jgi:catechol 2,3-dioxygenase-like lactoylglutathione lyase family enzyme
VAGIVAIGHVGLRTRDLEKLTAFYRDVLGLRLTVRYAGVVAIFEVGDVDLFLEPGERAPAGFDLAADDVDAFRERLVDAGVECGPAKTSRTTGHRSFTFTDPDGNTIGVTSPHPRTHAGPLRRRRSWSRRD